MRLDTPDLAAANWLPADARGPVFDVVVDRGGYVWWYVDALSDDGVHGLTLIAFIGSVFSPYYAWSGFAEPRNHCAVNVALYRLDGAAGRWAMTERGAGDLHQERQVLQIGSSELVWDCQKLSIAINEVTNPWPSRLRGRITVHTEALCRETLALDLAGRHRWCPIAPDARVELDLSSPSLSWSGRGYLDSNAGREPVHVPFADWNWARAHTANGTHLFYDVNRRDGSRLALGLTLGADGALIPREPLPRAPLPETFWRVDREGWCDTGSKLSVKQTLEDTPFYTRSALKGRVDGEEADFVHESLALNRLKSPIVRMMLPFRMPRMARPRR